MNALFGIKPVKLANWSANHMENLESALKTLTASGAISKTGRIVAVTDIPRDGKEVPVLEIIDLADQK